MLKQDAAVGKRISLNSLVTKSDGVIVADHEKADSTVVLWDGATKPVRVLLKNIRVAKA
jgi:hypothetical protein